MPHYRCYLLNTNDNIVSVDSVEADDDVGGMSLGGELLRQRHEQYAAIEIWHGKRLVGRIANATENASKIESLLQVLNPTSPTGSN